MNFALPFRWWPGIRIGVGATLALLAALPALAQDAAAAAAPGRQLDRARLAAFVAERAAAQESARRATERRAAALGLPLAVERGGELLPLAGFDAAGRPLYLAPANIDAARTISTDQVWAGGGAGLGLDGSGQLIGIWDVGGIRTTHQELAGRVTPAQSSALSSHATFVAGTLIASGIQPAARGMASGATLRSWDMLDDTVEIAAAQLEANPLQLSNHSYGLLAGWEFGAFGCPNGLDPQWYYIGNVAVSTQDDAYFGLYEETTAAYDQIAHAAPDYLMFRAAGNDRGNQPPVQPISHCQWNGSLNGGQGGLEVSSIVIPKDGGESGYDTLMGGGTAAKNVVTVGAVADLPGGYAGPSSVVIAPFSGWGPTDDGRIKPDIVANGVDVFSTWSSSNSSYNTASGTSAAAPGAAGSTALLRQYAASLGQEWHAATWKALILHTADEAGPSPGPDYSFGWGLMNTRSAAEVLKEQHATGGRIRQGVLAEGGTVVYQVVSDGAGPLKATLVWTDPAAPAVPPTTLDSPDLLLVNDLDLSAGAPGGGTLLPWVLDPANPATAATTGDNDRDNVEQIYVAAPTAGIYTFTIGHEGALAGGMQAYSLVLTGARAAEVFADGFEGGDTGGWSLAVP